MHPDEQTPADNGAHLAQAQPGDAQISAEFRTALERALAEKRRAKAQRRIQHDIHLDRHEAKYVIPPRLIPEIREFVRPFCEPDPHGRGDPPHYTVTTLQLDNDHFSLHFAKLREVTARFKLRARIYENPGDSEVYMEIKRKYRGAIVKTRARVPFDAFGPDLIFGTRCALKFRSRGEEIAFYEFLRIAREIGARPVTLVRYQRESYFGVNDSYARVTFDTKLEYQPTDSWTDWGRGGRWIPMDSSTTQNKASRFSGAILELKTLSDAPIWMIDLVEYFNLERTGHCKYCNAVWQESLFTGEPSAPVWATELLAW
jgi:hypothetical protein